MLFAMTENNLIEFERLATENPDMLTTRIDAFMLIHHAANLGATQFVELIIIKFQTLIDLQQKSLHFSDVLGIACQNQDKFYMIIIGHSSS